MKTQIIIVCGMVAVWVLGITVCAGQRVDPEVYMDSVSFSIINDRRGNVMNAGHSLKIETTFMCLF